MGLFDRNNEPVFIKETSDSKKQLEQLQLLKKEMLAKEVTEKVEQEIRFVRAGIAGEDNIAFELKHSHMPMYILHDLYLEDGELSAQIDYVIVTKKLIFIIECKNLVGNIEINSKGDFIRTININGRDKKEGIYSPITQNERHLELIKKLKGKNKSNIITKTLFDKYFYDNYKSLVVLANSKTVLNDKYAKKEIKEQVIRADQLINCIKVCNAASKIASSSQVQMEEQARGFLAMHVEKDRDYTKKFTSMIEKKEKLKSKEEKDIDLITEDKQFMKLIKKEESSKTKLVSENKADDYPKNHEELKEKQCPKCNAGKLISRKGKFGSFLGCSNYPKCKFTVNIEKI